MDENGGILVDLEAVRAWVVYKGFEVVVGGKIGGILGFSL